MSSLKGQLPQLPSLAALGLSVNQIKGPSKQTNNKTSDGNKKVPYKPALPRNVRVFQSKREAKKTYPQFKISSHSSQILALAKQYQIFAVDSPTGTGKTRFIPYLLASNGFKVRVAIPTTVVVRDVYRFQKENTTLTVGYATNREIHYSDDDQLVYATTSHLTERIIDLIKSGKQNSIRNILGDVLFIDEVHTVTKYITLLIGLLKYLYITPTSYSGPKIIFLTATFNHGDIIDYFPEFPVYKIDIEFKPITDIFLPQSRDVLDDPNNEIERIVREELNRWQQSPIKYHGVIFRPGLIEVEETIEYLQNKFSVNDPIEFYPVYNSLRPNDLIEIFNKSSNMKVIVGMNIIELTAEDIGFIIDDFLEKITEASSTGGNKLTLTIISKAGSQQRRSVTGRTVEGRAYKLISKEQFEKLSPFREREIDRIPIFDIIIKLIDAGLDPRDILKISIDRYQQARRLLLDLKMIENRADRYFVTDIGHFVSSIPLGIQSSYMIYLGYQRFTDKFKEGTDMSAERILFRSIIAAACMIEAYGPSYFYIPRRTRDETQIEYQSKRQAHIEKYHVKFRGVTDIHTFVNIFWQMMIDINIAQKYDQSTSNKFTGYIQEWTKNNSMNNEKIKEYFVIMRDVQSLIEAKISDDTSFRENIPQSGITEFQPRGWDGEYGFSLGRDLPEGGFTFLGNIVANVFAEAYSGNRLIRNVSEGVVYVDPKSGIEYKINQSASFNQIVINEIQGPIEIIAAETIEAIGKYGGKVHLAGIIVSNEFFPSEMLNIPDENI